MAEGFYTIKGYELLSEEELTNAMEDYLEMIARICHQGKRVRVSELSVKLHVKASSATKMVQQLVALGFLEAEKYGDIILTKKGQERGAYLLYRHDILHHFLCLLNHTCDELEQVEKIEHFLDQRTIKNIENLSKKMEEKEI